MSFRELPSLRILAVADVDLTSVAALAARTCVAKPRRISVVVTWTVSLRVDRFQEMKTYDDNIYKVEIIRFNENPTRDHDKRQRHSKESCPAPCRSLRV